MYKIIAIAFVILISLPEMSAASTRDLYRKKSFSFIELRVAESKESLSRCLLQQVYSSKVQSRENEQIKEYKKGKRRLSLIHWGKNERNSIELEEVQAGHSRVRWFGWNPRYSSESYSTFEPCAAKGDGSEETDVKYDADKDRSIAGRIIGNVPAGKGGKVDSQFSISELISCISSYPSTISYDYSVSDWSTQLISQENGAIKIGWYKRRSMRSDKHKVYHYYILRDNGENRTIETFLPRFKAGEQASKHWVVKLANACAADGNNDAVRRWPRRSHWRPKNQ